MDGGGYNVFRFSRALGKTPPTHSRSSARSSTSYCSGTPHRWAWMRARASGCAVSSSRPTAWWRTRRSESGQALDVRARYLVDATGRDALLGGALKLKRKHPRHRSAALFAHFRGVERRPGEDAGNISIYAHENGWAWMIPLRQGIVSVGIVADRGCSRTGASRPAISCGGSSMASPVRASAWQGPRSSATCTRPAIIRTCAAG